MKLSSLLRGDDQAFAAKVGQAVSGVCFSCCSISRSRLTESVREPRAAGDRLLYIVIDLSRGVDRRELRLPTPDGRPKTSWELR